MLRGGRETSHQTAPKTPRNKIERDSGQRLIVVRAITIGKQGKQMRGPRRRTEQHRLGVPCTTSAAARVPGQFLFQGVGLFGRHVDGTRGSEQIERVARVIVILAEFALPQRLLAVKSFLLVSSKLYDPCPMPAKPTAHDRCLSARAWRRSRPGRATSC